MYLALFCTSYDGKLPSIACWLYVGLGAAGTALTLEWGLTRRCSLQVQRLDRNGINNWKRSTFFCCRLICSTPSPVNLHWHAVPG